MGKNSAISWTHHTFNPWWGCVAVSPGCANCYAAAQAARFGHDVFGAGKQRRFLSQKYWNEPLRWNNEARKAGERHRVFVASMADVFERNDEDVFQLDVQRGRLWDLIAETPALDWLLLTKRPENVRDMVPTSWLPRWPPNVWLGTTIEDQRRADERIPLILQVPAAVRFLSCEPLLERVDLSLLRCRYGNAECAAGGDLCERCADEPQGTPPAIDWVICGGESGPRARPFDLSWARGLRDQCAAAGTAFFMKQVGRRPVMPEAFKWEGQIDALGAGELRLMTPAGRNAASVWGSRTWHTWDVEGTGGENSRDPTLEQAKAEAVAALRRQMLRDPDRWHVAGLGDRAGADPAEWPEDLRVQCFPEVAHG